MGCYCTMQSGGICAGPRRASRACLGPRADNAGPRLWERGRRHRRSRHRPGGARHRRAACAGQGGRAAAAGPPLLHAPCPACIACILVGDLFSERSTASALWAWLYTAHRQGVQVLIADASRPFVPTAGVRCLWEERLATAWAWEGTLVRTVRLLTLDV